jgi:hypothetical protein
MGSVQLVRTHLQKKSLFIEKKLRIARDDVDGGHMQCSLLAL